MTKEQWHERKPVNPVDVARVIKRLGTHATTIRLVAELKTLGYRVEEDILSFLLYARRRGILIHQDDSFWRVR